MAYSDQALLSGDGDFIARIAACAAVEVDLAGKAPQTWAAEHVWLVAAAPTFADKYASALAGGAVRPGNDQSVIADPEILAAVQALA